MRAVIVAAVISFLVSIFGTPLAIRIFTKLEVSQPIRSEGPKTHLTKRGTPTMGGVVFIVATLLAYVAGHFALSTLPEPQLYPVGPTTTGVVLLGLLICLGVLGFIDDFLKVSRRNSLGLKKRRKLLGQMIVGAVLGILALYIPSKGRDGQTVASAYLSFVKDVKWLEISKIGALLLFIFVVMAMSNAVNLTDGLDGLATGTSIMVLGAYAFIAFWQYRHWAADPAYCPNPPDVCGAYVYEVRDPLEIAIIAAAAAAACFGFLWWNASPARIFMGDTGSLALGGLIAGLAFATRTVLLVAILGLLFTIITVTWVIQIGTYQLWQKRVFRMVPLQHHFELAGWSEVNIVIRFWIIAGLGVAAAFGLFYADFLRVIEIGARVAVPGHGDADYSDRTVLVVGTGVAGAAAARGLLQLGARVRVCDRVDGDALTGLHDLGAQVVVTGGGLPSGLLDGVHDVVVSPGVAPHTPIARAAVAAGLDVYSEPELAWRLRGPHAPPWLAVTGTDGKTTTVTMLAAMLAAAGRRTAALGNIGEPLVGVPDDRYDVIAVELTSFQLYWSSTLAPSAGAMINLADDHLEWHGDFAAYAEAKTAIWRSAGRGGVAVGNLDDAEVLRRLAGVPGRRVGFSLEAAPGPDRYGVREGWLVAAVDGRLEPIIEADRIRPAGRHNVANALAAAALAATHGVGTAAMRDGLAGYVPQPHRNQFVASVAGVAYVDDSKATNPHAAQASLTAYPRIVWIAGGQLKGVDIDDLVAEVAPRLVGAVLLGVDRAELAQALARHAPDLRVVDVGRTDDGAMGEVVRAAAALARPGDTVLLAPAAASKDMFASYNHRGDAFAAAVQALSR